METDKNSRLLYLYEMLIRGEGLQKKEAAARFKVNERSIQRDIDCLRNFFAGQNPPQEILYNAKEQRYVLTSAAETFLTCGELLAVCKILLDSRSMPKDEMEPILDKLLSRCASPQSRKVSIQCGEILRINQTGRLDRETFDDSKLFRCRYPRFLMNDPYCRSFPHAEKDTTHLDELKTVALAFGYSPEDIDLLAAQGFTADELEDLFYSGEI